MNDQTNICFTLEAALEDAIQMENGIFGDFLSAIQAVRSPAAKEILRDAALGKLRQKQQIERALLEGTIDGVELHAAVPTMRLDTRYGRSSLHADADAREALAYAIHVVTGAVEYYDQMANACTGAPMSKTFARLSNDQTLLLQELEDSYEEHFLTEN